MYPLRKQIRFIVLALLLFSQVSQAQYVFRHWDIADGLSDNQIRYFTPTPDGRIAIRTVSILNIYNGATFEHFYHNRHKRYKWSFNRYQIFKEYHDTEGRMWMKAPGYLLLFDLNTNEFIYDIDRELHLMNIDRKLKNLFIDESKNYWFLTEDNVFIFYDITQKQSVIIDEGDEPFTQKYGIPEEIAQYKNLYYILYSNGLLRCWDSASREFVGRDTYFVGKISDITDRLSIHPTSTGDLWLMYNNAVCYYNRIDKTWREVVGIKGASNFFTCMDLDTEGNAWIGTSWSGLRKIDGKTFAIETISGLKLSNSGILNNDIQCIYADDNGGVWVGTLWQGVCYYNPSMYKFGLIQTLHNGTPVTNEAVRCLFEDEDSSILIGTTTNGLRRYDPSTGKIAKAFNGLITNDLCLSLYRDRKNRLWVGTYLNGFYCLDGNRVKIYNRSTVNMELYPNQNISRAVYEDPNGRFWVSVDNEGVGELNLLSGKISMLKDKHPEIAFHKIDYNFYPIDDHCFAVYGENGIYYYNTRTDKVFIPKTDDPDSPKLADPNIRYYCIFKDSRGLEWFGTEQGIRIWDDLKKKVYIIDVNNGLSNNSISSILEGNQGEYWISTVSGIAKIEIKEIPEGYDFSVINYNRHDGLQDGKFYDRSSLKTRNGNLYFGGHHGVNWLNPDNMQYNKKKSKPVFTAFRLYNQPIRESIKYNGRVILEKSVGYTKEIRLNYAENFITLEFAGLNYANPSHTYYRYKLENYDLDWNEILTSGTGVASYTGLPPGKYRLIVYTANNDKVWGDEAAEISIWITPPFWATVYAYFFYALLLLSSITGFIVYLNKRNKKRIEERYIAERQKYKDELNQMKFRFFTNISHEFRTPLTLIMTPLSSLIQQYDDSSLKQKLSSIYRNAEDMLGLINQLLDFRKLEMGGEKLKLSCTDFIQFMEYVHATFMEFTENKSIYFTFESACKQLFMYFDQNKIHKIINNLYSNAFKFTPAEGHISTMLSLIEEGGREFVKITVSDTGCGIDEAEQQAIFERFYQSSNNQLDKIGSGIGLHLVKEYVELHQGRITVNSKPNEGSVFTIYLPTDLAHVETAEIDEGASIPSQPAAPDQQQKTLLIVEDNHEFRRFLAEQLSGKFNVLQASDGREGEEIALKQHPDLIVSDLMMPVVDGLELCCRLKNNIQTSHVPVILLTARLSDEAKIESYKAGADSYIAKPFNFEVLETRIEMLIEQQEKRKKLFHKTIEITPSSITTTSLDEELVKKALLLVEKNINNPDYSVEELSSDIAMSRSQLYRKFHSILGLSPNDFIRSVRLKRAAQLLKESQYHISEISDRVGFNTIKYFNRYFKDEFGVTPTQYRQNK
ncbi:MAG: response regulator [Dysgonamonadaceae bacterium]|jgi:signal transduction histidine kinase/DNA-binding response OmpR family regulator/ligand-binding sensor domain-containing protein|nr:response regulator [Dysgonamonadaceae bacterium]